MQTNSGRQGQAARGRLARTKHRTNNETQEKVIELQKMYKTGTGNQTQKTQGQTRPKQESNRKHQKQTVTDLHLRDASRHYQTFPNMQNKVQQRGERMVLG